MPFVRFSKLVVVVAAIAVGLFLSIASHAFGWSTGSTFAVACALIGVLALTGPALILLGQTLSEGDELAEHGQGLSAGSQAAGGGYESQSMPQGGHRAHVLAASLSGAGEVEKRLWLPRSSSLNYGVGEVGNFGELLRGTQRDLNAAEDSWNFASNPRRKIADEKQEAEASAVNLAIFDDFAGRQRSTTGEKVALLDRPERAVFAQ